MADKAYDIFLLFHRLKSTTAQIGDHFVGGGFTDHARMQFHDDLSHTSWQLAKIEVLLSPFNITDQYGGRLRHGSHERLKAASGHSHRV